MGRRALDAVRAHPCRALPVPERSATANCRLSGHHPASWHSCSSWTSSAVSIASKSLNTVRGSSRVPRRSSRSNPGRRRTVRADRERFLRFRDVGMSTATPGSVRADQSESASCGEPCVVDGWRTGRSGRNWPEPPAGRARTGHAGWCRRAVVLGVGADGGSRSYFTCRTRGAPRDRLDRSRLGRAADRVLVAGTQQLSAPSSLRGPGLRAARPELYPCSRHAAVTASSTAPSSPAARSATTIMCLANRGGTENTSGY